MDFVATPPEAAWLASPGTFDSPCCVPLVPAARTTGGGAAAAAKFMTEGKENERRVEFLAEGNETGVEFLRKPIIPMALGVVIPFFLI